MVIESGSSPLTRLTRCFPLPYYLPCSPLPLDLFSLILDHDPECEEWVHELPAELPQVKLVEVDYVAEPVNVGLLRALDAVAEGHVELTLDEHSCTIFFVIFIPEPARVHTKHLRSSTDNFW